jgi:AraC-like DNA-binding protein
MASAGFDVRIQHPCGTVLVQGQWSRSRENSLNLRDQELWMVWYGQGWMQTHAGRFELRPGFCVWMRPGGIYDAGLNGEHPLGFTYVHFTSTLVNPPEFFELREVGFVDALLRKVVADVGMAPTTRWGRPAQAPAATHLLLRGLLLDLIDPRHRPSDDGGVTHRMAIEAMAARMRERPEERFAVRALARRLGVSLPHFSRLFRRVMGVGPREYQLRVRIDRARHLLAESDLSISQIAVSLGYGDLFAFSRQFAQHAGVSPTRYRRALTG